MGNIIYSQFHKTLPNCSLQMHWIPVRFYEMDDRWIMIKTIQHLKKIFFWIHVKQKKLGCLLLDKKKNPSIYIYCKIPKITPVYNFIILTFFCDIFYNYVAFIYPSTISEWFFFLQILLLLVRRLMEYLASVFCVELGKTSIFDNIFFIKNKS